MIQSRAWRRTAIGIVCAVSPILAGGVTPTEAGDGTREDVASSKVEHRVDSRIVTTRGIEDFGALVDPDATPVSDERGLAARGSICSMGAFPEGEANCGLDGNGQPSDNFNGGCSSASPSFFPTFCGDILCGTSAWNGLARDTDWYEITIFSQAAYTWEVTPDFDAIIGLAGGTMGVADCQLVTGINPFRIVPQGQTDSVTVCLTPGTWWFVVIPDDTQDPFPCGREYEARLTCDPMCPVGACCFGTTCDPGYERADCLNASGVYLGDNSDCMTSQCTPPANDDLVNAAPITLGATVVADLRTATLEPWGEVPPCAMPGGVASVWYSFMGNGEKVSLSTCLSGQVDPAATDSVIALYTGDSSNPPVSLNPLLCNDDAGCGGTGRLSSMCTFATQPGVEYFIQVLCWSEDTRGQYALDTDIGCGGAAPAGACCIPTTFGPFCDEDTPGDCDAFGGVFQGSGTLCVNVDCTGIEIPANDNCDDAILLSVPDSELGDTSYATDEGSIPDGGLAIEQPGVWYRVVGTGNTITVSLCSGNTNFDAKLHAYCNDCSELVCVAANDDSFTPGCGLRPEVSWCSDVGTTYWILVSGALDEEGPFEILVSDDGQACANPASCDPFCFVTCPPGATLESEPGCTTGYVDTTNPGCGAEPPVYGQIQPGETICGESGTFPLGGGRGRDVDWFEFSIEQECDVTWTVQADYLVETFILTDECGLGLFSYAEARGNACQDVVVQVTLQPGDYTILVQPQFFFGVDCGSDLWWGSLDCVPTPNNGACCLDATTCIETTEAHCIDLGGGFGQAGQTCAQVMCQGQSPCPGDFNNDTFRNVFDFNIFAPNFGIMSGATHADGDMDNDGDVDVFDFNAFAPLFGVPCP